MISKKSRNKNFFFQPKIVIRKLLEIFVVNFVLCDLWPEASLDDVFYFISLLTSTIRPVTAGYDPYVPIEPTT